MKKWLIQLLVPFVFSVALSQFVGWLIYSPLELKDLVGLLFIYQIILQLILWFFGKFTKTSTLLLIVIAVLVYLNYQEIIAFISSSNNFYIKGWIDSVRWAIMLPEFKFELPTLFSRVFSFIMAYASAMVVPLGFLSIIPLTLPLFFVDNLTSSLLIPLLLMALVSIYIYSTYRKNQSLNVPLIVITLLVTGLISYNTTPYQFYSQRLHQVVNKNVDGMGTGFSLTQVGFSQNSGQLGGPIRPSLEPFMVVDNNTLNSFYLKGSSYDGFRSNRWFKRDVQNYSLLDLDQLELVFNPQNPSQTIIDPLVQTSAIFHGTEFGSMELFQTETTVSFNNYGEVLASQYLINNYHVYSDIVTTTENAWHLALNYKLNSPKHELINSEWVNQDPILKDIIYNTTPGSVLIQKAINHLSTTYSYTLEVEETRDFLSSFTRTKEGYCVYFASALTLLLQDVGYEARYVEGFLVPSSNQSSRLVRKAQAHAWVEVELEDGQKIIIDPTPPETLNELTSVQETQITPEPEVEPVIPDTPVDQDIPVSENQPETPDTLQPTTPETDTYASFNFWWLLPLIVIGYLLFRVKQFKDSLKPESYHFKSKNDVIKQYETIISLAQTKQLGFKSSPSTLDTLTRASALFGSYQPRLLSAATKAINESLYSTKPIEAISTARLVELVILIKQLSFKQSNKIWFFIKQLLLP